MVHVEAGESKLLLFETFSFFFFPNRIYRGDRAPKNTKLGYLNGPKIKHMKPAQRVLIAMNISLRGFVEYPFAKNCVCSHIKNLNTYEPKY